MNKMNSKNIMMYSSIVIAAILLLVVGGQGYMKVVAASCHEGQAWEKGYNDAQNDFRAGNHFDDGNPSHQISPIDDYKAGYSQGYVDAREGLILC
jgi:hypothetical protein